jgi:hypothetical protein
METICNKICRKRGDHGSESAVLDFKNGTLAQILFEISIFYLDCRRFYCLFIYGIFTSYFLVYSDQIFLGINGEVFLVFFPFFSGIFSVFLRRIIEILHFTN